MSEPVTSRIDCSTTNGSEPTGYLSVSTTLLKWLSTAPVDLFVRYASQGPLRLYRRGGTSMEGPLAVADGDVINNCLYVRAEDFACLGSHTLASLEASNAPPGERYAALQMAMGMEIERALHVPDCSPYVAISSTIARDVVSLIGKHQILPVDLFRLARHDFTTFTHVTNVASYAVMLAEHLGISDRATLEQIAVGAMLHDLGKRFLPVQILTKGTRLDSRERELIETHPTRGYEELCQRPDLDFGQLMIVYQHHERMDGTGYPVGSCGDEIHLWARIVAVVDVFEAMTGVRPYRRPVSAEPALDYLRKMAGTHFDLEVVQCWSTAIHLV